MTTATSVEFWEEDLNRLEAIIPLGKITGARYDAASMKGVSL